MKTKTTTTTTRTTTHELEGRELLKVMGIALAPGDRARVYVEIPSGGDYSGRQLNLDEHGVTIKIELARETTSETIPLDPASHDRWSCVRCRQGLPCEEARDLCRSCGHARVFHRTGDGVPVGEGYCDDRHSDYRCSCKEFVER